MGLSNGGKLADELSYIPMPANVVELIHRKWKAELTGPDGKPINFNDAGGHDTVQREQRLASSKD